jgi:cell wall-associated NlpC family hydrolase
VTLAKTAAGIAAGCLAVTPLALAGAAGLTVGVHEARTCAEAEDAVAGGELVADIQALLDEDADLDGDAVAELPDPQVQIENAAIIWTTGHRLGVPARGQVIALATALQESSLRNLDHGDRDSRGLFQQRPSQGWGSAEQIQDSEYAATAFYQALLEIPGWEELPLTDAAQAVQRSAYPDAYARWEPLATALHRALATLLGADQNPPAAAADCRPGAVPGPVPPGTVPEDYEIPDGIPGPVHTAIAWALAQLGTPYQWGGSCTDPHGQDPMGRCDCSSLMQAAYAAAGVTISRTTYVQVADGHAVTGDIQPGDLVFTRPGPSGPEHVGMYIGQGLVVHAPRTGEVIRLDSYAETAADVVAVRRIVG